MENFSELLNQSNIKDEEKIKWAQLFELLTDEGKVELMALLKKQVA